MRLGLSKASGLVEHLYIPALRTATAQLQLPHVIQSALKCSTPVNAKCTRRLLSPSSVALPRHACLLASLAPIDMTFAVIFSLPFLSQCPSLSLSLSPFAPLRTKLLYIASTIHSLDGERERMDGRARADGGGGRTDTSIGKQTENNCEMAAAGDASDTRRRGAGASNMFG